MAPRLLVVEDDDLQQDILRSALVKRGYEVDVASDGLSALRMLRTTHYDLALIDYQLPEIDGFATARVVRDLMTDQDRPKLIAVTASADNLTGRSLSENAFDAIVPKSAELSALLTSVDMHLRGTLAEQTMRAAAATWRDLGLAHPPPVVVLPAAAAIQSQLLRCYFDLSGRRTPEAVLLLGQEAVDAAITARTISSHFSLPLIDLSGTLAGADAHFAAADHASWAATASVITRFTERRQKVGRGALMAVDIETRLLTYLFLAGRPFHPISDAGNRDCVCYPGFFPDGEVRLAAERLASRDLLDRHFFERYHVCRSCNSARLNVREECPACHSSQLRDMPIVHHFRCAHQAGEHDFIQGPHLVCPKCRQTLRHYGSDYDKPGTAAACGACGVTSPEPAIGFACMDCGAHTAGDAAAKRDIFGYTITDAGAALVRRGTARISELAAPSEMSLPEPIKLQMTRRQTGDALFELRYGAADDIISRRGEVGFAAMRRLFLENLVNALEAECIVASEGALDYLLIKGAPAETLAELGPALLDGCQDMLVEGLEPELRRMDLHDASSAVP